MTFAKWLGIVLQQSEVEVTRLLDSSFGSEFFVSWTILEGKRLDGDANAATLKNFAAALTAKSNILHEVRSEYDHFYSRYKFGRHAATYRKNLLGEGKSAEIKRIICDHVDAEPTRHEDFDKVLFLLVVIYRFRNNMFHGKKGVESWLKYEEQIRLCTSAMQKLLLHPAKSNPPRTSVNHV